MYINFYFLQKKINVHVLTIFQHHFVRLYSVMLFNSSESFSGSVMSDSLWPHGLQPTRFLHPWDFPGKSTGVGCHCLLWLFTLGDQNTGASASASVLPMNLQGWFPLGLTDLMSLPSRDSQESSPIPQLKSINSLALSFLHSPTLTSIHDHWKNHSLD